MRYDKPTDYKSDHVKQYVCVITETDEFGHELLKVILFPQHDISDPDAVTEYRGFEVQEVSPGRPDANTEIGVAGLLYEVTLKVSDSMSRKTRIWKEEARWRVAKSCQGLKCRSEANASIIIFLVERLFRCSSFYQFRQRDVALDVKGRVSDIFQQL